MWVLGEAKSEQRAYYMVIVCVCLFVIVFVCLLEGFFFIVFICDNLWFLTWVDVQPGKNDGLPGSFILTKYLGFCDQFNDITTENTNAH